MVDSKPATDATIAANRHVLEELDFTDRASFENAQRGFIATIDPIKIAHNEADRLVFDPYDHRGRAGTSFVRTNARDVST